MQTQEVEEHLKDEILQDVKRRWRASWRLWKRTRCDCKSGECACSCHAEELRRFCLLL